MVTDEIEYNAYYYTLQVFLLVNVAETKTVAACHVNGLNSNMPELLCILQNKFRRKYEQALTKCWMICVPCSSALRGIDITDEFVEAK
ncbi:hypothetical protein Cfor_10938 [Coptotermes formosanus]|uniref:Uncharacterized protein n=1 Tax=Coptotermes formosanus TaxID=36987 RepID=A0A6L2PX73_COPFO|nr:hypothetical protein Cfor_10938 [Coptotermes formosanus]